MQFKPQTPLTAATQVSSQAVMQQAGWTPQFASTQLGLNGGASQPDESAEPTEQSVCEQLPALSSQSRLSQIVLTRWMHGLSQEELQQAGRSLQIWNNRGEAPARSIIVCETG